MNILHLNSNYHQSSIYHLMVKNLNECLDGSGRVYYPVHKSSSPLDTMPSFLDVSERLGRFDRFLYFYRNKKLIKDINRKYNIDNFNLLLSYSLFSNGYLAYTLYLKYKIPYIIIVQNTDVNMYFKKVVFLRNVGRKILNNAHRVVFISQPYKDLVLNKYVKSRDSEMIQQKSVVIPFGIDDYWFDNLFFQNKQLNNNEIKLLFVGRVNQNKNVTTMINVCEYLIQKGYNITFTIVGNIEEKDIGSQFKYHKFIKYIPYANKEKLLQIYRQNDIFIMPSIKESFGLVYAEAMSQGLPVIYTRGQGFDQHFKDGKIGYSVDCFDIEEIANKIILIKEKYTEMSRDCVLAVDKFKWSKIVMEYEKIINQI